MLEQIKTKLQDIPKLQSHLAGLRLKGKRIVFTNGCFDLLHPGHISYLAEARSLGDFLIIGLNSDASVARLKGPSRPLLNQDARGLALASMIFVDAVCVFEEDTPLELIQALGPDILVKGGDYQIDQIVGAKEVQSWGGEVQILPFVEGYSTSNIVEKIKGQD